VPAAVPEMKKLKVIHETFTAYDDDDDKHDDDRSYNFNLSQTFLFLNIFWLLVDWLSKA